jgi:hypothetical protein
MRCDYATNEMSYFSRRKDFFAGSLRSGPGSDQVAFSRLQATLYIIDWIGPQPGSNSGTLNNPRGCNLLLRLSVNEHGGVVVKFNDRENRVTLRLDCMNDRSEAVLERERIATVRLQEVDPSVTCRVHEKIPNSANPAPMVHRVLYHRRIRVGCPEGKLNRKRRD